MILTVSVAVAAADDVAVVDFGINYSFGICSGLHCLRIHHAVNFLTLYVCIAK